MAALPSHVTLACSTLQYIHVHVHVHAEYIVIVCVGTRAVPEGEAGTD